MAGASDEMNIPPFRALAEPVAELTISIVIPGRAKREPGIHHSPRAPLYQL
jgi:hypothetical protein